MIEGTYRILVTTDLSEESLSAFAAAKRQAERIGPENVHITALTVLPSFAHYALSEGIDVDSAELQERLSQNSKKKLDEFVGEFFSDYATSSIILPGLHSAHNEIADYVNEQSVDLVVIATHGRSGVSRWILGSVTDRVLRLIDCPILVVPVSVSEHAVN